MSPYFSKNSSSSVFLREVNLNNETIDFGKWVEIYEQYSNNPFDAVFDSPVTLANLGFNLFKTDLTKEQRDWCFLTLAQTLGIIIQNSFNVGMSLGIRPRYNMMERELSLKSIPLLYENTKTKEEKNELEIMIIYFFKFLPNLFKFHTTKKEQ